MAPAGRTCGDYRNSSPTPGRIDRPTASSAPFEPAGAIRRSQAMCRSRAADHAGEPASQCRYHRGDADDPRDVLRLGPRPEVRTMRQLLIVLVACTSEIIRAAQPAAGEDVRLPVTRDTWFSNVGAEADGNNGGSPQAQAEVVSRRCPWSTSTRRRCGAGSSGRRRSTCGRPASRGCAGSRSAASGPSGSRGRRAATQPQAGSSTYNHRRHPDVPWTVPGSDLCARDPRPGRDDLADGRRLAARRATAGRRSPSTRRSSPPGWPASATGSSCSTTPARSGPAGARRSRPGRFPNRFVHSRESNRASAPYLTVDLGPEDRRPARRPGRHRVRRRRPAGRRGVGLVDDARATKARPARSASSRRSTASDVPRYLIPLAGPAGRAGPDAPARPRPGAGGDGHAGGPRRRRRRATSARRPRPRSASRPTSPRRCPGARPSRSAARRPAAEARRRPKSRSSTSWTRSSPSPAR